jgi:hypothetical protein
MKGLLLNKKMLLCFTYLAFFSVSLMSQNLEFSGIIQNDEVWSYDTVKVTGSITIPDTVCLEIAAGTKIIACGYYRFNVYGSIEAIGSETDSIYFTVNDTTNFSDTSMYTSGAWDGLHILNSSCTDSLIFDYCSFSYGKAISPDNDKGGLFNISSRNKIRISNSCFYKNICLESGGAIYSNCSPVISKCLFFNNKSFFSGGALSFVGGFSAPLIINNYFLKNVAKGGVPEEFIGKGAAIYISTGYNPFQERIPKIYSNTFIANAFDAIYESCWRISIANNVIIANYGGIQNGISIGEGIISNNVLYGNYGTVLELSSLEIVLRNNIIWDNHGRWDIITSSDTLLIDGLMIENADIEYCNVQYGLFSGNEGVLSINPEFVNVPAPIDPQHVYDYYDAVLPVLNPFETYVVTEFDLSLTEESLLINSGTPDTTGLMIPDTDFYGLQRVVGNIIDMGPIENQYVGIKEHAKSNESLIIFPNPVKNNLYLPQVEQATYEVRDVQGKIILQGRYSAAGIFTGNLEPGVYFVRVKSKGAPISEQKFVKM